MKKVTIPIVLLLLIVGGVFLYLYKTDFWSPKNIALRKLDSAEIPASPVEVKKAVASGDVVTLDLLKDAEVDFNAPEAVNADGDPPVHVAFQREDWETYDRLVNHNVNLDTLDAKKLPISSYLMEAGELEKVKDLFHKGADVNVPHASGDPALISYIKSGDLEKALFLLSEKADPNSVSTEKENALYLSLWQKQEDLRKSLLEHGVAVNAETPEGTPILAAFSGAFPSLGYTEEGAGEIIQAFIEKGVDLNAQDQSGSRPLQTLIKNRHLDASEVILSHDKNVSDTLWIAIQNNDYVTVERLLDLNADPNQIGPDGETPLITMIRKNRADIVSKLLDKGVDPEQMAKEGQSALVTAITIKHSDSALALLRHPENKPFHSRIMEYPVTDEFRDLFGRRGYFDWYTRKREGLTPLMVAVMRKELAVAEQLLENGADRFQKLGSTFPIQMAAENKDVKMQQLLIPQASYKEEDQVRKFVVDLSEQRVRYYKHGKLIKTSRISSGQAGYRTPTGSYVITDKTRHKKSNLYDGAPMPYFQRFSCSAIGFHTGNTYSSYASHGCIRLPNSTAAFFWSETELGDRVDIVK